MKQIYLSERKQYSTNMVNKILGSQLRFLDKNTDSGRFQNWKIRKGEELILDNEEHKLKFLILETLFKSIINNESIKKKKNLLQKRKRNRRIGGRELKEGVLPFKEIQEGVA